MGSLALAVVLIGVMARFVVLSVFLANRFGVLIFFLHVLLFFAIGVWALLVIGVSGSRDRSLVSV